MMSVKKIGNKCSYCNPNSALAKRSKKEEAAVATALADFVFQRETHISYSCISSDDKKFARLDFLLETVHHRVILEVDEHQHKEVSYSIECDLSRMLYVLSAIKCSQNDRPVLWIRFNPHAYSVDGVRQKTSRRDRYRALVETLRQPRDERFVLLYMYYDVREGRPTILDDPDFHADVKQHVRSVV
jgi:hypothetical protein